MDAIRAHYVAHNDTEVGLVCEDIGDGLPGVDLREVIDPRRSGFAVPFLFKNPESVIVVYGKIKKLKKIKEERKKRKRREREWYREFVVAMRINIIIR